MEPFMILVRELLARYGVFGFLYEEAGQTMLEYYRFDSEGRVRVK